MYLLIVLGFFAAFVAFMKIGANDFGIISGESQSKDQKTSQLKHYQSIMETLSILTFFILVITFFFRGKNDFGLKPKSKKD